MDKLRRQVVIGFLGSQLDSGRDETRWMKWRPSVDLCQHEDLLIDRFELLVEPQYEQLAETVTEDIGSISPETSVNRIEFTLKDPWDFEEVFTRLHEFARRYPFRPDEEEYLIHITTGTHVAQICLFLLAESRHIPARLLQTSPPHRNRQGLGNYRIIDLDLSRYDALAMRFEQEQREDLTFLKSGIETRNREFNALIEQIERVAISSKAPLLLNGSTGAGKSQLARRIYELKRRRQQLNGEFIEVNCATIRGDQAMSTLFGHVKGAFTGALGHRPGLLRAADGGLLFLDEIGELGLDEQAMLLRAIEEKRFLPLGSDKEVSSNFQLIAGTNRDLHAEIRQGRFRDDLLARINLWTFKLPGLANRRSDIAPNLDYELDRFRVATGQTVRLNTEARERFLNFAESPAALWKGNFRDLNAAITRMATLSRGGRITIEDVDDEISRLQQSWGDTEIFGESLTLRFLSQEQIDHLDLFDRLQLESVLQVCLKSRSLSDAGRKLFAASRQDKKTPNDADRLRKFLARFDLNWSRISDQQTDP